MPEACLDYDKSAKTPRINDITSTISYESVESEQDLNWNRSNSIDVTYLPLTHSRHYAEQLAELQHGVEPVCKNRKHLAASSRKNFCCCSGNSDDGSNGGGGGGGGGGEEAEQGGGSAGDLRSCWKIKRKQIIWESSHASAKNRTTTASITTRTTTTATSVASTTTPTLTTSLLPTVTTSTWSNRRTNRRGSNTIITTVATTTTNSNSRGSSNIARQVQKISTSLPTTPNLSQLRRPQRVQYKKLSWECGVGGGASVEQAPELQLNHQRQLQQQQLTTVTTQQLQMSATKLQTYASVCNTTNNSERTATSTTTSKTTATSTETQQMILKRELIADNKLPTAAPASTTATTTTTLSGLHVSEEQQQPTIAVRNNNNESQTTKAIKAMAACDNSAAAAAATTTGTTSAAATSIKKQQPTQAQQQHRTHTDHALFSHSAASSPPPLSETTTAAAAATTTTSTTTSGKSSLAFCEHCCGETDSSVRSSHGGGASLHAASMEEEDYGRFYRAHTDSVSDLSSYRFVSDEEDIIKTPARYSTSKSVESIESTAAAAASTTNNKNAHRANVRASRSPPPCSDSVVSSSPLSSSSTTNSPTICCYTIDKPTTAAVAEDVHNSVSHQSRQNNARVVESCGSVPVPIPYARNATESPEVRRPQQQQQQYAAGELFPLTSTVVGDCLLSTSLPRNYGSAWGNVPDAILPIDHAIIGSARNSIKCRRIPLAPPVPPKPAAKHSAGRRCREEQENYKCHNVSNSASTTNRSSGSSSRSSKRSFAYPKSRLERTFYDPTSFHRKVQKFETQNTLIGKSTCVAETSRPIVSAALPTPAGYAFVDASKIPTQFALDVVADNLPLSSSSLLSTSLPLGSSSLERSLSPEHCELLNCFGSVKNTRDAAHRIAKHQKQQQQQQQHSSSSQDGTKFIARSLSDSSCCSVAAATVPPSLASEKCAINQNKEQNFHNNNNNNNNIVASEYVKSVEGIVDKSSNSAISKSAESNNNNNNWKLKVRPYASEQQLPLLSAGLPQRTLRYDSHGRLKPERVSHLPTSLVANSRKTVSETRLYRDRQSVAKSEFKTTSGVGGLSVSHSSVVGKLTPKLCRKSNFSSDYVEFREESEEELENSSSTNNESPVQYNSNSANDLNKIPATTTNVPPIPTEPSNGLALNFTQRVQTEKQQQLLFKSYSDNNNLASNKKTTASAENNNEQRCFSDYSLKSKFPSSESSLPCNCCSTQLLTTTPISPTTSPTTNTPTSPVSPNSPASSSSLLLHSHCLNRKNSHSLPSVQHSNGGGSGAGAGSHSPLWLSSETIESRYSCSDQKCLDDVQSNCSDQTTIFHLDNDCSLSASSSSPSSQSVGAHILRGPLILKRIPAIQSFGYIPGQTSNSLGSANVRDYGEKEINNMEKRRNTLDRFQRLGFGRKSSANSSSNNNNNNSSTNAATSSQESNNSGSGSTRNRKTSEKSERLKELTELLRGNRSSPTPPPVPPPRKPRNGSHSASSSFEKPETPPAAPAPATSTAVDSNPPASQSFMSTPEEDIMLMDQDDQATTTATTDTTITSTAHNLQPQRQSSSTNESGTDLGRNSNASARSSTPSSASTSASTSTTTSRLYDTLKPNTSLSNFESLMMNSREKSKSPPAIAEVEFEHSNAAASMDLATQLTRPESRTVIGSYTQKGIPFRSASFSQIDYSSGKYKKSALSALRDRLRRDKAVDTTSPRNSVVDSVNLTLPRRKDEGEPKTSSSEKVKSEPDWIYIPLKKTEMSINLSYGQESKCLEDVLESPDGMPEEEIFTTDLSEVSNIGAAKTKQEIATEIVVAHAKMESLTDTIHSENDYTIDEELVPVTVESANLIEANSEVEVEEAEANRPKFEVSKPTIIEPNLATLMEEQVPFESPPENFLQTATTCLIPVPVYECAAQEWRMENPPHEWVEVAPEEFGIIPETIEPLMALELCAIAKAEVPTISVSRSSEEADDKSILRKQHQQQQSQEEDSMSDNKCSVERRQTSVDYPEVKKRYSHDDMEIETEKRTSLDGIATRYSADERKRIDKSKRRKGMYIENADWCDATDGTPSSRGGLALDISIANFNAIKPDSSPEECGIIYLNSPAPTEDNRTPGSMYSFDLNTPDSECTKPPVWTKEQRLTNFSLQSSEEKDDVPQPVVGGIDGGGGGSGGISTSGVRQNKSYPFLRTDSVSDNESDRTPPPSTRDRTSPSPASSEYDFKRFSKRPLRGPYGQMLEAEMKKPNKMHFEEILEELRESDVTSQPRRQRAAAHDDASVGIGGGSGGIGSSGSGSGRNLPQYSNSMRVRKTSTYLPVPAHARAASTPSQIENVNNNNSSKGGGGSSGNSNSNGSGSIDKINSHEKRYQSSLDNSSMPDKEYQETVIATAGKILPHHLREMKRAASEAPAPKPHHSKRSQSMSTDKQQPQQPLLPQHQQKRSLDVPASSTSASSATSAGAAGKAKGAAVMPTQQLLAELLKGSSEKLLSEQRQQMFADTRTHVVQEIFKNEQSYVESLQTVVVKYLRVLKTPEHAGMIDSRTVDEIFFMVPDILEIHEKFLAELRSRLDCWDTQQKVGDAFMETFSKLEVLEVYTSFVNNCNRAKNAIRSTKHQRPSFAKFLETTAREHKGKLTLDNLLIKPVQKFPNYEMLFQRLIKHTDHDHPDQKHLQDVLKLVHDILVHINCKEREILENGQREATLRELEGVIEGITDLIAPERQFLLFDLVTMPSGQGARKERGFFLFNDLLVLTSIKKRSGTIRKPNTSTCPGTVASTLDTNKYKFLIKISLDCLEIVKTKDENFKRIMNEIENLAEDCNKLQQIADIAASLKYPHTYLEEVIHELQRDAQRQLSERQTNDAQLNMLELTFNSPNGSQKLATVFSKTEKRTQWEETFNEAKQKLAATLERHPIPEFLTSIPIRKTRAGLQFTCAAATLSEKRDVWVCNSDGYVGQVCIMSLHPEPNVTSCNGVCNARILCVASVPAYSGGSSSSSSASTSATVPASERTTISQPAPQPQPYSYTQQLREYRKSISPNCQPASAFAGAEKKKMSSMSTLLGAGVGAGAAGSTSNSTANLSANNGGSDIQLDLNLSSSDDEGDAAALGAAVGGSNSSSCGLSSAERIPSPAPSTQTTASTSTASTAIVGGGTPLHSHQDSNPDEGDGNQSTMWIGTEDGCIHVYNSTDNIRIKKNRIKIEHSAAVYSILYLDNRVFVSLANGDICVYLRDGAVWNTSSSHCISMGSVTSPITKLISVNGKLWLSQQGFVKIVDTETLQLVTQITISPDKPITNMTVSNNYVWISIQNSAHIKCYHSVDLKLITEVNLAPAVNKMLSNCDEIIRQHKAACLRVTSLLSCRDLIWIGTSAGVLLTIPAQGFEKPQAAGAGEKGAASSNVVPTGIPHGHTGHVRFLTFVETAGSGAGVAEATAAAGTSKENDGVAGNEFKHQGSTKHSKTKPNETNNILIISGGDGYEDFRNSGANSLSEIAGREDSTNHLLIWQI